MIKSFFTSVMVLLVACARPDDNGGESRPATGRQQVGDTLVVRTTGANSPLVELTLEQELVIGKAAGSDPELLGRIDRAIAAPDGGVLLTDVGRSRIQRFDSNGRFIRSYGSRGEGPGEFMIPGVVGMDARGNVYHAARIEDRYTVWDSAGTMVRTWQPKSGDGVPHMVTDFVIDSAGSLNARSVLRKMNSRGSMVPDRPVIVRSSLKGKTGEMIPEPKGYGPPPAVTITYKQEGGYPDDFPLPFSHGFGTWFVPPGVWVSGHNESYRIHVHRFTGGLVRIESDLAPTMVSSAEREDIAALATMEIQASDKSVSVSPSQVAERKPFFRRVRGDQSERLWVELHRPATRIVETACPPSRVEFVIPDAPALGQTGCADGSKPRPLPRWVEPVVYDVFLSTGEFAGRVTLPANSLFKSARGNKIWLQLFDSLDVQTMVRYRVVPNPTSPLAAFWK